VHAGEAARPGSKICNKHDPGRLNDCVCEGFSLAEKLGLSAQTLFDICSTSTSQCWAMTGYCRCRPVRRPPSNRDYAAGFTAANMLKDLRLAQQAAGSVGAATPMGARRPIFTSCLSTAAPEVSIFRDHAIHSSGRRRYLKPIFKKNLPRLSRKVPSEAE